ncbi:class I lanthipeptide [Fulvivirga sp. M361]|uniref:class I lanthipeptide n=1 Tax=Fulvivirga sp. M361 TaxID=2594266 RepID=UPI001C883575
MKDLSKKLSLRKSTITNLTKSQMFATRGGNDSDDSTGRTKTSRCSNNRPTCCACSPCDSDDDSD